MVDLQGYGPSLLLGMVSTLKLTCCSLAIGLCLGLMGAVAGLSRFTVLRRTVDAVTTLIRGIPELLFVLAVYLGSSVIINRAANLLGYTGYIDINAFWAGIIALSMIFGAYASEVFRGAIQAVDLKQIEAAQAFGMTRFMTYKRVIFPQMWRIALPGLGNLFLVLMKNTALLSVIGVQDLMRNAVSAVGYTRQPFIFYLSATFLYLLLTAISMMGIGLLEKRAALGVKKVM